MQDGLWNTSFKFQYVLEKMPEVGITLPKGYVPKF